MINREALVKIVKDNIKLHNKYAKSAIIRMNEYPDDCKVWNHIYKLWLNERTKIQTFEHILKEIERL